ncbi:MAG: glycosyltransferase family 39 protein, partial [Anaerolineae bacterium]|nr:glycosyltransferase family 39 protein [Anaerolineae bacterium]
MQKIRPFLPMFMLLMAFWLRVNNLADSPPGMSNDESIYLIDTFNVARGGVFTWFEHGRPEPGFQLILSTTTRFFGGDPFAVRLTPIFLSMLAIAIVYWATQQILYDRPLPHRQLAGLLASGGLMTSLGFITLSRAIERGIPQILFMALFIGMLALFLHHRRTHHAILAGISLAGTIYFYTAGLALPAVLAPIGLWLILFHARAWRTWFFGFFLMGIVTLILTAPWSITLLTNSHLILDRAGEVMGTGLTLDRAISLTWSHLLIAGDPNPQYNTASDPMILSLFQPLFILGLGALLIRVKNPTSIAIITFLALGALPPLLTNEPIHGIRAIGMFGAFPFIIGLGAILLFDGLERILSAKYRPVWALLAVSWLIIGTIQAQRIYTGYWQNPPLTRVYVDALTVGEWFFRQDRRDVARWLMRQNQPVLMPMYELNLPTTRAWTINHIPNLAVANDDFILPDNTRLFVSWYIEENQLRTETRLYALVNGDTITLLPPLSNESHTQLIAIAQSGDELTRGR